MTNITRLNDQQRRLCEEHMNLVHFVIHKHFPAHSSGYDELASIGYIALCKAALWFDPDRGIKFTTFAPMVIRDQLLTEIRKRHRLCRDIRLEKFSLDAPFPGCPGTTFGDVIPDPVDMEQEIAARALLQAIGRFTGRDAEVLHLSAQGYSQREIAKRLHTSQPYVSQMLKRIKHQIAQACG